MFAARQGGEVRRTEEELLGIVYERSAAIRRRRRARRTLTASLLTLVLAAGSLPRLLPDSGSGGSGETAVPALPGESAPPAGPGEAATTPPCTPPTVPSTERAAPHGDTGSATSTSPPAISTPPETQPGAGERIAFASDRSGDWEIYTMNADGTGVFQVTHLPGVDREPDWSPDGTQLAFVRLVRESDVAGEIYVVNADGTGLRLLGPGATPRWAPDGRHIAFWTTATPLMPYPGAGWLIDAEGGTRQFVAENVGHPAWLPDGRGLVFGGLRDGVTNVVRLMLDGSEPVQLTNDPVFACIPAVSPDGRLVAYISTGLDPGDIGSLLELGDGVADGPVPRLYRLWLMNLDGTGQHRLTTGGDYWESYPSWSADGSRIVFARDPDGEPRYFPDVIGPRPSSLWVINADGSGLRQLTDGPQSDADPAFGPPAPSG